MARSAATPVETPGAVVPDGADAETPTVGTDPAARIAELEAQAQAQAAEIERLRTAQGAEPKLPQVVYEPETVHGKLALQASPTGHLTTAQVQAAIEAKELPEPMNSYLCRDGYYVRRG